MNTISNPDSNLHISMLKTQLEILGIIINRKIKEKASEEEFKNLECEALVLQRLIQSKSWNVRELLNNLKQR